MPGSTTWRQRSSTSEGGGWGGFDVHLGFNMLIDPACEGGEGDRACVCLCVRVRR